MGAWVFRTDKARISRQLEHVYATFPALTPKRHDKAGSLSGGQGRMLSVAREMMTDPRLLLIDEPTVGLAPNLVAQVYEILAAARKATGAAILLVEQNVEQALPLADRLYLLNLGQVKAEGPGASSTTHGCESWCRNVCWARPQLGRVRRLAAGGVGDAARRAAGCGAAVRRRRVRASTSWRSPATT